MRGRSPSLYTGVPRRTAAAPLAGPGLDQATLLHLQRTVGNAAVAGLLATNGRSAAPGRSRRHGGLIVQRDDGKGTPTTSPRTGEKAKKPAVPPSRDVLESVARNAERRFEGLAQLVTKIGPEGIDGGKGRLQDVADEYEAAYRVVERKLQAAGEAAESQRGWVSTIIGIGVGTVVGLAGGPLIGALIASKIAAEAAGELVEAAAGAGLGEVGKALGYAPSPPPLQRAAVRPEVLELWFWKDITELHQGLLNLSKGAFDQARTWAMSERLIAELRSKKREMNPAAFSTAANALLEFDRRSKWVDERIPEMEKRFRELRHSKYGNRYYRWEMEQDIWILWTAEISYSDSDILDIDVIENHLHRIGVLGRGSRLGVDFGMWTSKDDEMDAIYAAKSERRTIEEKLRKARNIPYIY